MSTRPAINTMAVVCVTLSVLVPMTLSAAIEPPTPEKDVPSTNVPKFLRLTDEEMVLAPMKCYCNLPVCGDQTQCTTRYGCFSELQPLVSHTDNPATNVARKTRSVDFEEEGAAASSAFNDRASIGSYGCLDMLAVNKTCEQILESMEGVASEFPKLPQATAGTDVVRAYHCCQRHMCNDESRVATTAKTVQDALAVVIRNSMSRSRQDEGPVAVPPAVVATKLNDAEKARNTLAVDTTAVAATLPIAVVAMYAIDLPTAGNVTRNADWRPHDGRKAVGGDVLAAATGDGTVSDSTEYNNAAASPRVADGSTTVVADRLGNATGDHKAGATLNGIGTIDDDTDGAQHVWPVELTMWEHKSPESLVHDTRTSNFCDASLNTICALLGLGVFVVLVVAAVKVFGKNDVSGNYKGVRDNTRPSIVKRTDMGAGAVGISVYGYSAIPESESSETVRQY